LLLFDDVASYLPSCQERLAQCFGIGAAFFAGDPEAHCGDAIM
jgi:hypothetical protein